jgi:hypothetical protein
LTFDTEHARKFDVRPQEGIGRAGQGRDQPNAVSGKFRKESAKPVNGLRLELAAQPFLHLIEDQNIASAFLVDALAAEPSQERLRIKNIDRSGRFCVGEKADLFAMQPGGSQRGAKPFQFARWVCIGGHGARAQKPPPDVVLG